MTSEIPTCRIWGQDYTAVGQSIPDPSKLVVTESDRAGGGYVILGSVDRHIAGLEDGEKARLTTWLVDQRLQGNLRPVVSDEIVEYAINKYPLLIYERAGRLLRFLSKQTTVAGEFISLFQHSGEFTRDSYGSPIYPDMPTNPTFLAAMAWSESISPGEISYLVDYLEENGWVQESFKGSDVILRSHQYLPRREWLLPHRRLPVLPHPSRPSPHLPQHQLRLRLRHPFQSAFLVPCS